MNLYTLACVSTAAKYNLWLTKNKIIIICCFVYSFWSCEGIKNSSEMSYLSVLKKVFYTPNNEQSFDNLFEFISVNLKMIGKTML